MSGEQNSPSFEPIQKKLKALREYNVLEIVPRLPHMKPVPVKWVFTIKNDGTRKARFVAIGCRDVEKYTKEELASPTPTPMSVRCPYAGFSPHRYRATGV